MSLYSEIDSALAELEIKGALVLTRPKQRTESSFRSTIYNVLKNRGISAKVSNNGGGEFTVAICKPDEVRSGLMRSTGRIELRTPRCTTELVAAAAVFIDENLISGIEFVGATQEELTAVAGEHVDLKAYKLESTPISIKLLTNAEEINKQNHFKVLEGL